MKLNVYTICGIGYATVALSIAAVIATFLGVWTWLLVVLWSLWAVGHVVFIWYCRKITRTDDLEASLADGWKSFWADLRAARGRDLDLNMSKYITPRPFTPEQAMQAEHRVHRVGEVPVVYDHPDFNVKGTLSGRAGEEIVDLENMDRGGSE